MFTSVMMAGNVTRNCSIGFKDSVTEGKGWAVPSTRPLTKVGVSVGLNIKGVSTQISCQAVKPRLTRFLSDVDPCVNKNGGCSHTCNLVKGKRECSCPDGYKLGYDSQTCKGL